MAAVGKFLRSVGGWKGYAAAFALGALVAGGGVWKVRDWMVAAAALKAARADLRAAIVVGRRTQAAAGISQDVGRSVEAARAEVRIVYRTITERVPVYVTPEIDRAYPVPVGFVRLHDAAAQGSTAALPDRPGEPADVASGIALSAVADTVAGNYETCIGDYRERLIGWQTWYEQQKKAWEEGDP